MRRPCLLFLLCACVVSAQEITVERLNQAEKEPHNWLTYGGTYKAWRYSPLDQINAANVSRLVPVWAFQTGDVSEGLQCTPLVADGRMYIVGSNNRVFALEAATGKKLWSYFYKFPKGPPFGYGHFSRGLALAHGNVYLGTLDNYVVALDSKSGEEVWKVNVEDSRRFGCNITGAPLVVKDMVIVGSTGGDSAHRGHLVAFDAKTGRLRWRFNTIPGPGEKGNESWSGESWKFGGGSSWMTGSYDPDLDLIYCGIGNPAADFYGEARQGTNLYTDSVVALKADTGELAWYFQEIPHDVWDYDSAYECILLDLPVQGQTRKLLVNPNKGGYVWVVDRASGAYVSGWKFMDNLNWSTGLDGKGVPQGRREPAPDMPLFLCPSISGARSWNHASYSPRTGLLYNIGVEWCTTLTMKKQELTKEGEIAMAGTFPTIPPKSGKITAHVDAHDPVTGKVRWRYESKYPLLASLLSTGGDLVFTGDPEGIFFALDARSGKKLWSFATGSGHRGSPISYSVGGRQYIATPSGPGGPVAMGLGENFPELRDAPQGGTLFVFALAQAEK